MTNWEKYCFRHCFNIPEGFVVPEDVRILYPKVTDLSRTCQIYHWSAVAKFDLCSSLPIRYKGKGTQKKTVYEVSYYRNMMFWVYWCKHPTTEAHTLLHSHKSWEAHIQYWIGHFTKLLKYWSFFNLVSPNLKGLENLMLKVETSVSGECNNCYTIVSLDLENYHSMWNII